MEQQPTILLTKNGEPDNPNSIQGIVQDAWSQNHKDKDIVIWIHGGLVDEDSGTKQAKTRQSFLPESVFPINIVWRAGVGDVLIDTLVNFLSRKFADGALTLLENFIEAKLQFGSLGLGVEGDKESKYEILPEDIAMLDEAVKRSPELSEEQRYLFSEAKGVFRAVPMVGESEANPMYSAKVDAGLVKLASETTLVTEMKGAISWWKMTNIIVAIAIPVLKRYRLGRERVYLRSTIIEEMVRLTEIIGEGWEELKKDAEAHFSAGGAGTLLFAELRKCWEEGNTRRVIVVGHSTGGVMINKMLETESVPGGFHLRLLANAARMDSTRAALSLANRREVISSIRWFVLKSELEQNAELIGEGHKLLKASPLAKIYLGSLLYFVSGALERPQGDIPLAGIDAYLKQEGKLVDAEIDDAKWTLNFIDQNLVLAPTERDAKEGFASEARKHGDFSTDLKTVLSVIV